MIMPTLKELQKEINYTIDSVKYGDSRAVLNNMNDPVIAYCIGFAGFVTIYQKGDGFPQGVGYTVKHLFHGYPDASFNIMKLDEAEEIIRNNKLAIRREINEELLQQLKEKKHKKGFVRPLIGKITIDEDSERIIYKIYGLKEKGKYAVRYELGKSSGDYKIDNDAFIGEYNNCLEGNPRSAYSYRPCAKGKTKIIKNTVPFDVIGSIMRNNMIKSNVEFGSDPIEREKNIWKEVYRKNHKKIGKIYVTMTIARSGEIKRSVPNKKKDIYIDSLTGKEITKYIYLNWVMSSKV